MTTLAFGAQVAVLALDHSARRLEGAGRRCRHRRRRAACTSHPFLPIGAMIHCALMRFLLSQDEGEMTLALCIAAIETQDRSQANCFGGDAGLPGGVHPPCGGAKS
jgi:hypothetical protein